MCMAIIEELQTLRLLRIRINVHVDLLIIFETISKQEIKCGRQEIKGGRQGINTIVDH